MKHFEGTSSGNAEGTSRNQILAVPEGRDSSDKSAKSNIEGRTRNQILAMPEGRESSKSSTNLEQSEGKKNRPEQSKHHLTEKGSATAEKLGLLDKSNSSIESANPRKHLGEKIKDGVANIKGKAKDWVESLKRGKNTESESTSSEVKEASKNKETFEEKKKAWEDSIRVQPEVGNKKKSETSNNSDNGDNRIRERDLPSDLREAAENQKLKQQEADKKKDTEQKAEHQEIKRKKKVDMER